MEIENPIIEGYLLFPPHGVLGQLKFQKAWQRKYCQLFKESQHGIQRLEVFDSEEESRKSTSGRIITLENCIKIIPDQQNHQQYVFLVVTRTLTYYFAALTENEMKDWLHWIQTVAFNREITKRAVEEDNELYCSSGEGVYTVRVVPTDASKRCGLNSGPYTLLCLESEIQLMRQSRILLSWPYRYIRRYGHKEGTFTFEAGRKCPSGAGSFHFEHGHGEEVFRCIASRMRNMRKMNGSESALPSPSSSQDKLNSMPLNFFLSASKHDESHSLSPSNSPTVCMDELLQAAVNNMEAGSRSPLSAMPGFGGSGLPMNESNSSLDEFSLIKKKSMKISPNPIKCPRKISNPSNQGGNLKLKALNNPVGKLIETNPDENSYDKVEFRTEAWKTLGVSDLLHSETMPKREDDKFPKERKKLCDHSDMTEALPMPSKSKIIVTTPTHESDDDNYDKLQHLGMQTSKRSANNVNSRYKHVNPMNIIDIESRAPVHVVSSKGDVDPPDPSSELDYYDDVQNCMQAVRLADDSHLGYGQIRKKVLDPDHSSKKPNAFTEDVVYAVIEKPKKTSPKP